MYSFIEQFSFICCDGKCILFILDLGQRLLRCLIEFEFEEIDISYRFEHALNSALTCVEFTMHIFSKERKNKINRGLKLVFKERFVCCIRNASVQSDQYVSDPVCVIVFHAIVQCKEILSRPQHCLWCVLWQQVLDKSRLHFLIPET